MRQPLLTNLHVYRAVAEEAGREAQLSDASFKTPKPDGAPGFVLAPDPKRTSFKQSLIAITFSAVYLEALMYLKGTQLMGSRWRKEFDRKNYQQKLVALGATDPALGEAAERLRRVRNDLVHEKATPVSKIGPMSNTYWAQVEAAAALKCIHSASVALSNVP